jgi:hypothetical protein
VVALSKPDDNPDCSHVQRNLYTPMLLSGPPLCSQEFAGRRRIDPIEALLVATA